MLCPDLNALHLKHKPKAFPGLGRGHTMKQNLQYSVVTPSWARKLACLATLLSCASVWAQTELNPSPAAMDLQLQARAWYSQQKSYSLDRVQMSAMDSKLAVKPCAGQVRFDQPFQNQNVIRARCSEPNSQYFMTAQVSTMALNKAQNADMATFTPNALQAKTVEVSPINTVKAQPLAAPTPSPAFLPPVTNPASTPMR